MIKPVRVILTKHAVERALLYGLTIKQAVKLCKNAIKVKLDKGLRAQKQRRWEGKNDGVYYKQNGLHLFTVVEQLHQVTGDPILIVITITDMRINLKRPSLALTGV